MEQGTRLLMGWKLRTLEAYGFSFGLLAVLVDSLPLGLTGASATLSSSFLSYLKATLPGGWQLIGLDYTAFLEVSILASLTLALLITYPAASYVGIRFVTRSSTSRRTLAALVALSVVLFYVGAIVGFELAYDSMMWSLSPLMNSSGMGPIISGYDFYTLMLRGVLGLAVGFSAPVYVVAAVKFRRAR